MSIEQFLFLKVLLQQGDFINSFNYFRHLLKLAAYLKVTLINKKWVVVKL